MLSSSSVLTVTVLIVVICTLSEQKSIHKDVSFHKNSEDCTRHGRHERAAGSTDKKSNDVNISLPNVSRPSYEGVAVAVNNAATLDVVVLNSNDVQTLTDIRTHNPHKTSLNKENEKKSKKNKQQAYKKLGLVEFIKQLK